MKWIIGLYLCLVLCGCNYVPEQHAMIKRVETDNMVSIIIGNIQDETNNMFKVWIPVTAQPSLNEPNPIWIYKDTSLKNGKYQLIKIMEEK